MAVDASMVGALGHSATSSASTTGGACTTGDTLVIVVSYDPTRTISTLVDTAGNTYSLAVEVNNSPAEKLALYYKENATGHASNVATVTCSAQAFPVIHLIKVTGALAASYDSGSLASNNTDTTSPFTITSGTLAQADSVVIACCSANRTASNGDYLSSNFTILSSEPDVSSYWSSGVSKLVVAATTAVTPSHTRTGSVATATRSQIVVAFKATVGAVVPPIIESRMRIPAQLLEGPDVFQAEVLSLKAWF